jgi:N-acetylglucosaminyl-diphospho-decaprenol L-rhamnosyltransferase
MSGAEGEAVLTEAATARSTSAEVGAVVVNYNAGGHLSACVASLRADGVAQVVVVDNASADDSVSQLRREDPRAVVIEAGANLGYGAGVNRGLAACSAPLVLVTNPDVVVRPGSLAALAAALEIDEQVAIAGPRIEDGEGRLYPSARGFPSLADSLGHAFVGLVAPANRFTRRYQLLDWDHQGLRAVDWVSGACFLARRSALSALSGFDESYFMFGEDVDLCWRANQAGFRVLYQPAAVVTHLQGISTRHRPYRMIVAHHRSLLRFACRSTTGAARLLLPAVALGLGLRACLLVLRQALAGRAGRAGLRSR